MTRKIGNSEKEKYRKQKMKRDTYEKINQCVERQDNVDEDIKH